MASDDVVKICDLGIATECVTESGEFERGKWRTNIGTNLYKAPEQVLFLANRSWETYLNLEFTIRERAGETGEKTNSLKCFPLIHYL